jgi:hypothetical protein
MGLKAHAPSGCSRHSLTPSEWDGPEGRWLGFVVSHPCRKVRGMDRTPRGSEIICKVLKINIGGVGVLIKW